MTGHLLTGREVAELLNVSNKTVLRWALAGRREGTGRTMTAGRGPAQGSRRKMGL